MFDEKKIGKIAPQYWRDSYLSPAKDSGEVRINGTIYVLDTQTDYLVRKDIYKHEQAEMTLNIMLMAIIIIFMAFCVFVIVDPFGNDLQDMRCEFEYIQKGGYNFALLTDSGTRLYIMENGKADLIMHHDTQISPYPYIYNYITKRGDENE